MFWALFIFLEEQILVRIAQTFAIYRLERKCVSDFHLLFDFFFSLKIQVFGLVVGKPESCDVLPFFFWSVIIFRLFFQLKIIVKIFLRIFFWKFFLVLPIIKYLKNEKKKSFQASYLFWEKKLLLRIFFQNSAWQHCIGKISRNFSNNL